MSAPDERDTDPVDDPTQQNGDDGRVTGFADESFNTSEYRALRALFRDECHEGLDRMAELLLGNRPSPDWVELLRITHSLKGTAGTVGLGDFADIAHLLESVLEKLQAAALPWTPAMRDALVEVADGLRAMVDADHPAGQSSPLRTTLAELAAGRLPAPDSSQTRPGSAVDPEARPAPAADEGNSVRPTRRDEPTQLRVDPARIDRLMDGVGELVFDRTRIERRIGKLRGAIEEVALLRDAMSALPAASSDPALVEMIGELSERISDLEQVGAALAEDAHALRRTGNALQDGLTGIRMQSARALFQRLAPQVRALARSAGKSIRLLTEGDETEFDKAVADAIGEPLIHLLRNALAHGIEDGAGRRAAGKPEQGTITLAARQEGSTVFIEVSDDGAGIDLDRLRDRLVEAGHWSRSRADSAEDDEVLHALLDARVSSRDKADALAGRGIGIDAVRDTVARLGGELELRSASGHGTTFTLRLPLTTSIANAMLFKVGGHVFAIANVHVVETTMVEVSTPTLPSELAVAGETVPLVVLHAALDAPLPADARGAPAVVIDYASRRLAFTCDKIVGPREIVVKTLGPLLSQLPMYVGGTISGSGKVQLILDPAALVRLAYPQAGAGTAVPGQAGRVLVADDSRAVRQATALILERAGYKVDLADNGQSAWRMLGRTRYDALVTDLEMPEVGGFELISRLRDDDILSPLPVIILSSRANQAARVRAAKLGVRSVLAKPVNAGDLVRALAEK